MGKETKKQFTESDAMQEIFKRVGSLYNEFAATGKNATIKNFANFLKVRIQDMQYEIQTLKNQIAEYEQKQKDFEIKFAEKEKQLQEAEAKTNNANTDSQETEKLVSEKDEQIQYLKQQLAEQEKMLQEAEQRANENARIATVETEKKEIAIMPEVEALLKIVSERLSEKYKKIISEAEILNVMFLRYNVEKWSQWFYPFVLTEDDIKDATGKTVNEWKTFFNSKNK